MTDTLDATALRALADAVETATAKVEASEYSVHSAHHRLWDILKPLPLCKKSLVYQQVFANLTVPWGSSGVEVQANLYTLRALVAAIRRDADEAEVTP